MAHTCEQEREQLASYAAGELVGVERTRLEQHLASCAACRQELDDLGLMMRTLEEIPAEEAPDTLVPRVSLALRERLSAPGVRALWPRLAVPVAVLTGVIAVTFALQIPKQQKMQFVPGVGSISGSEAEVQAQRAPLTGEPDAMMRTEKPASADEHSSPAASNALPAPPSMGESHLRAEGGATAPAPSETYEYSQATESRDERQSSPEQFALDQTVTQKAAGGSGGGMGGGGRRGVGAGGGARAGMKSEAAPAPAAPMLGDMKVAGARTISQSQARAIILQTSGKPMLGVELPAAASEDTITYQVGRGPLNEVQWQSEGRRMAVLPLPTSQLGSGPASLPLEIKTSQGTQLYTLYVPPASRLGKPTPIVSGVRYSQAPLSQVLLGYASATGLAVLTDAPGDTPITGTAPAGPPAASLRELATANNLTVESENGSAITLTQQR